MTNPATIIKSGPAKFFLATISLLFTLLVSQGLISAAPSTKAGPAVGPGNKVHRNLDEVLESKHLSIFVYENFPPFSYFDENKKLTGVDVDIGIAMAKKLGVTPRFFVRDADENVDDDLRINIWKGHFIGGGVADVMMHVPVDDVLRTRNPEAVIFGRYFTERMSLLLNPAITGKAETVAPFIYTKVGVELDTLADFYLSSPATLGGKIANNVVRYKDFTAVIKGLQAKEVSGLMGPRAQIEAAAKASKGPFIISSPPFPGMAIPRWDIGMAVSHRGHDLSHRLGDIIIELREQGELKRIFNSYGLSYYKDFLD